ncbi:hypothetical protein DL96DRAFT_1549557 [Flagelloscypha sp. PMI_526]|nr:hypothetical protein DL96DRAFT_1549557 [Flagelloscypha sp. PMI_526]
MPRERGDSISAQAFMPTISSSSERNYLTDHLWNSFLERTTSDVSIRVTASWRAVYHLHKVVIIQSDAPSHAADSIKGFFRTLFTAGFSEASSGRAIDVVFDDANITRTAFEYCIARLYGGGPPVFIPSELLPTTSHPLTTSYPWSLDSMTPSIPNDVPKGQQPGSPAFLLSLLATSVYLSVPSVATQALSWILSSVGPHTVIQYLDFACGKPITNIQGHQLLDNAAVGLENVAEVQYSGTSDSPAVSIRTNRTVRRRDDGLEGIKNPSSGRERLESISMAGSDSSDVESDNESDHTPSYHYGTVSDKIGEACVCWLARWSPDILQWEEQFWHAQPSSAEGAIFISYDSTSISGRRRASTAPSVPHTPASAITNLSHFPYRPKNVPLVWSQGGLSAQWICALISSDTFFVRGEKERYDLAKRVVDLRHRLGGVSERDKKVWNKMFEDGIYYANMTMEELISISQDLSSPANKFGVSLSALHAAHWDQSLLKHHLIQGRTGSPTASPSPFPNSPRPKDNNRIGLSQSTTEIRLSTECKPRATYFEVTGDTSSRLGDCGPTGNTADDPLFRPMSPPSLASNPSIISPSVNSASATPSAGPGSASTLSKVKSNEANFFGLVSSKHPFSKLLSPVKPDQQWALYPPFRFAVEFFDIDALKEKSRLHSQTFWYAGSLFNVYTQVVRKKSANKPGEIQTKMGIYLHRQSSVEVVPMASAPSLITERVERERRGYTSGAGDDALGKMRVVTSGLSSQQHSRGPSLPTNIIPPPSPTHYSPSIHPASSRSRPTTPGRPNSAGGTPSSLPNSSSGGFFPSSASASILLTTSSSYTTPNSMTSPSISTASNTLPATAPLPAPSQPYRDPRGIISAYFAVSCASATGTSQTRFTSSPDDFSIGQSWGWTSSTLRTEEYMRDGGREKEEVGKEVSLRATVIVGLV